MRGSQFDCEKCGAKLKIKPKVRHEGHSITITASNGKGQSKNFPIVIRADGIWQFGDDDEREAVDALEQDTDRAVAVIAASMLETRLTEAILCMCNHVPDIEKRHFHPSGAMGSFSIKIDLAYMLQIITEQAYKDLLIIKDVRNRFAHRLDIKNFKSQWVIDKISNLKLIETHIGEFVPEKGAPVIRFGSADKAKLPRIFVYGYKHRLEDMRERYLTTVQLFMVCLAPGSIPDMPMPLI